MEPHDRSPESAPDDGVSAFLDARPRIFAAAYRTLRNAAEAEDISQDVWLRWRSVDRSGVRDARSFLATTTRRLAINRALEARTRHEVPMALWLGDPVDPDAGPGTLAERGQALETALRLLLEKLSPLERAAYVLRTAFNYSFRRIAERFSVSEANCRQLVGRARKRLAERRRLPVTTCALRRITLAFVAATQGGDLSGLEGVLSADIAQERALRAAQRSA